MGQTEPSFKLGSNFGHLTHDEYMNNLASPTQAVSDLPTWTTLGNDEGSEINQSSAWRATNLAEVKQHQAAAQNTVTAKRILKTSADATPSKRKKARFDGVHIVTKPPFYRTHSSHAQRGPTLALSLVDALARTFDANRHSADPRQPRTASYRGDDASTAPPTDVETTEAENEQTRLNARLVRTPLKRHHTRTKPVFANASETNFEDAASLQQDIAQPERPVKRLKPIQYESNSALIDAALGTIQAPIGWDAEMDIIIRGDDFVDPALTAHAPRMDVGEGDRGIAGPPSKGSVLPSAAIGNERCMLGETVLSPYLSRGAKFRQRLEAIFGENATVRTDRAARPRPADHDLFTLLDEPDRDSSPNTSETTVSVSSASVVEEGASAIPSTHITSQSPDIAPSDTSVDPLPRNQPDEVDSLTNPTLDTVEEQMSGWITALQRLVKGKVHVKEEDLEALSIILAEIESLKDSLDGSVSMNSELRESVKQLSQLHEIPFGDRNRLRQRAKNIFHTWPPMGNN